jgi:hypothetical protein
MPILIGVKDHRAVGQVKSPPRIPVSALTTEHLSAVAAFERWQRESPHSDAHASRGDRTADSAESSHHRKN